MPHRFLIGYTCTRCPLPSSTFWQQTHFLRNFSFLICKARLMHESQLVQRRKKEWEPCSGLCSGDPRGCFLRSKSRKLHFVILRTFARMHDTTQQLPESSYFALGLFWVLLCVHACRHIPCDPKLTFRSFPHLNVQLRVLVWTRHTTILRRMRHTVGHLFFLFTIIAGSINQSINQIVFIFTSTSLSENWCGRRKSRFFTAWQSSGHPHGRDRSTLKKKKKIND